MAFDIQKQENCNILDRLMDVPVEVTRKTQRLIKSI